MERTLKLLTLETLKTAGRTISSKTSRKEKPIRAPKIIASLKLECSTQETTLIELLGAWQSDEFRKLVSQDWVQNNQANSKCILDDRRSLNGAF